MDIWEILRRWHSKQSITEIAQALSCDRKTIRRYIRLAVAKGLCAETPLPSKESVLDLLRDTEPSLGRQARSQKLLEQYLPEIALLINDPALGLKPKIAFEVLCERHLLIDKVSYTSFKRFTRTHQITLHPDRSSCRIEVPAGSEVQIDYAKLGTFLDSSTKRKRTLYAFIATLSFSRHKFVELVFSQDQKSFVGSHVRMLEYFGGVPLRIVLDNLKSGIIKPDLYDPSINRSYREMAEHYHCFIDPCRVASPKDKGKVERDVQTVRQEFRKLCVLNPGADIAQLNRMLLQWASAEYGQRKHGTTQQAPFQLFTDKEQPALKALPQEPFEAAEWKEARVHPDHYIQFNRKAYSVPHPYVGKSVWVRGTERLVQIYYAEKMIKQHLITDSFRHTDHSDFPENVRAVLDTGIHVFILHRALKISPRLHELFQTILKINAFVNLRKVQGMMTLAEDYPPAIVDSAAGFAIEHKLYPGPKQFRELLDKLQSQQSSVSAPTISEDSLEFVRDITYFISQETIQ
jgi:transposase